MNEVETARRAQTAINLLRRWRAHRNDGCASLNTLFAVFGIRSLPMNPPYSSWLEDIAYCGGARRLRYTTAATRFHPLRSLSDELGTSAALLGCEITASKRFMLQI